MKRIGLFLGGWFIGVFILNKFVFALMLEFVKNEIAVSIMCVVLTTVYAIVLGCVVTED